MSNLNIAIVGTDTAAGKLLLEKLEESSMEIEVLYPLEKLPEDYSSIRFRKKTCLIEKLDDFDFTSVSLVFFTGSRKNISEHITRALESGCYVIDDTGAEVPDYDVMSAFFFHQNKYPVKLDYVQRKRRDPHQVRDPSWTIHSEVSVVPRVPHVFNRRTKRFFEQPKKLSEKYARIT